jgi:hypothetical protein
VILCTCTSIVSIKSRDREDYAATQWLQSGKRSASFHFDLFGTLPEEATY